MSKPSAVGDLEDLLDVVQSGEANMNDDEPCPAWVGDMIDDLKTMLRDAIDYHSSRPYERVA